MTRPLTDTEIDTISTWALDGPDSNDAFTVRRLCADLKAARQERDGLAAELCQLRADTSTLLEKAAQYNAQIEQERDAARELLADVLDWIDDPSPNKRTRQGLAPLNDAYALLAQEKEKG